MRLAVLAAETWDTTRTYGSVRDIEFDTDQGTNTLVDASPDGHWLAVDRAIDATGKWMRLFPSFAQRPQADFSFPFMAEGVADIVRAGGNAAIGGHGEVPGLGDHWEMQMYRSAMTPAEVLRMATLDGARFVGLDRDLGSLEPGKIADLLVLNSNPLEHIEHALDLAYVMKDGILYDARTLSPQSTIFDTFGSQMLTAEGKEHEGYRQSFKPAFAAGSIRENLESSIEAIAAELVGEFEPRRSVDLRTAFVARLLDAPPASRLGADELKRNLSIVCFGGISTVEALLLNTLWALFEHPSALDRVVRDRRLLAPAVEETMRWMSPVQSATRHVTEACEWRGVRLEPHDVVNCMLGAANRDPGIFKDPDLFDLDRPNVRRHLGFATGTHACLGLHLARAEVQIGLRTLLEQLPHLRRVEAMTEPPSGYEFRQPCRLTAAW